VAIQRRRGGTIRPILVELKGDKRNIAYETLLWLQKQGLSPAKDLPSPDYI